MGQFISEMQFTSLNKEYLGREKKSISHDPNCNILSPISLRGSFNQFFHTVNWLNHYLIDVMLNTDMYFYYKKNLPLQMPHIQLRFILSIKAVPIQ